MALDTQARVRLNLGSDAPIEVVAAVLADLSIVCQFGGELQRQVDRRQATVEVLRRSGPYFDEFNLPYELDRRRGSAYWLGLSSNSLPPSLELQVQQLLSREGRRLNSETLVQEVSYRNPFDAILLVAGGGVVLKLLQMIRDWPTRRRINDATAEDYEDQVRARKRVRATLVDSLVDGDIPITPAMVDALLTNEIVRATDALGRADVALDETPPASD